MSATVTELHKTPSGLTVVYYPNSHRYKISRPGEDLRWVPSVSTILDKSIPKNLSGWVERLTVKGHIDLRQIRGPVIDTYGPDAVLKEMHALGCRYYQERDKAADRGTDVHTAFEQLSDGKVPNLRDWPLEQRGYIQGFVKWWLKHEPKVLHSEIVVGSWSHQYAGRMDLLAEIDGRVGVIDLKTSKAIRESHHFQTQGYMIAVSESGYAVPEFGAILRTAVDGAFEYVETHATAEDFIALKNSMDAQKRFADRTKENEKKAAA